MNINRAIYIKSLEGDEFLRADPDEIDEAERLSIEALKREKVNREDPKFVIVGLLPGETKEN